MVHSHARRLAFLRKSELGLTGLRARPRCLAFDRGAQLRCTRIAEASVQHQRTLPGAGAILERSVRGSRAAASRAAASRVETRRGTAAPLPNPR